MAAGAIGGCWESGSWEETAWEAGSWADIDPEGDAHTLEARASFDRRIELYASVDDTITGRGAL